MKKKTIGEKVGWMKYWQSSLVVILILVSACTSDAKVLTEDADKKSEETVVREPETKFGINIDRYTLKEGVVEEGWTLSHLLAPFGIDHTSIMKADAAGRDSLVGLKYIVAGKPFTAFIPKEDTLGKADFIVYESSITDYFIFDFTDSLSVKRFEKPIDIERKTIIGEIVKNSNLTETINQQTGNIALTGELAESIAGIFAWSIDFFKLQAGDRFKVIYEEKSVEGIPFGMGRVEAVVFEHWKTPNYAFYFALDSVHVEGYYDETGKEMKRPFLMAPVKFSRISSGFTSRRFHPVQKRYKAHLGTDYAAPTGTPIFSTADGTVIEATRSQFNGIYVKVRHNDVYMTQYLHMSRIEDGIRPGVRVKQGQTIGYVGSTGLATGPHVCYRFWKNGKQVDHRSQKLPKSEPLKEEVLPIYLESIKEVKEEMDNLSWGRKK